MLGPDRPAALERMAQEYAGHLAALSHFMDSGQMEPASRMVRALRVYWEGTQQCAEGRAWVTRVLACPEAAPKSPARAMLLDHAASLAFSSDDVGAARALWRECLDIRREVGPAELLPVTLAHLGIGLAAGGHDLRGARAVLDECVRLCEANGVTRILHSALSHLAKVAIDEGKPDEAGSLLDRCEAVFAETDKTWAPWTPGAVTQLRAVIAAREGNVELARELFKQGSAAMAANGLPFSITDLTPHVRAWWQKHLGPAYPGGIQLHYSTGDDVIDRVMRGYIGAFEAAFPGRLRCFAVAGGYAEGTATPLSDIDGGPVFKGPMSHDEWQRATALIRACSDLARIHLDAGAGTDIQLYDWRETGDKWVSHGAVEQRYYCKLAYKIIWGEEFREPILLPPFEYWVRACFSGPQHMGSAPFFIAAVRDPARADDPVDFTLTYPVDQPDRDDPFYGYARRPLTARDGTVHLTTRTLVRNALAGANAMVAWKARRFVTSKADVAQAYGEEIGGPWADLVADVDHLCRVELRYLIPEAEAQRRRLRALCADMPAFENHVLEQLRGYLLEELRTVRDESAPLPDGEWIPAELAGWLLERSPDDVQALGREGNLPTRVTDGTTTFAARPCIEQWLAKTLDRVRFPDDSQVTDARRCLSSTLLA